jgi:hypothetical protein
LRQRAPATLSTPCGAWDSRTPLDDETGLEVAAADEFPYLLKQGKWTTDCFNQQMLVSSDERTYFFISPWGWREDKYDSYRDSLLLEEEDRTVHRVILDTKQADLVIDLTDRALKTGYINASSRDEVNEQLSTAQGNQPYTNL